MSDRTWVVTAEDAGLRLDKFLADATRLTSRGRATDAIAKGKVFVNGTEVDTPSAAGRVAEGDRVRVWMDRPGSSKTVPRSTGTDALRIVYEDAELLVADKPPGLLTVPLPRKPDAPSLADLIELHFRSRGKRRPHVVHRIDRDTSGLVVFAKDQAAQDVLQEQFARREPDRVYLAVVYGRPTPQSGTWRDRLIWDRAALVQKKASDRHPRGAEAISDYRVVETLDRTSLIEVRLVTGKRNQIRIQAGLRGHALVGEERYVYHDLDGPPIEFGRQALHAARLSFLHPATGKRVTFEAPLPQDMSRLVNMLRRRARQRASSSAHS
jgi:23S rRNA pseudouridine1911/1915/1917 synthase